MSPKAAGARKFRFGRVIMLTLLLSTFSIFLVNVYKQQQRIEALTQEKQELTQTKKTLSTEKSRLDRLLEYTKTDEYIEQYARDRLGWVKPGETLFQLPEGTNGSLGNE